MANHQDGLTKAVERCEKALARDKAFAVRRAELWTARQNLANELTNKRDALHAKLGEIAREKKFRRNWADSFFLAGRPKKKKKTS